MTRRPRLEWAVIENVFRGFNVLKGELGTREEAEAWLVALNITKQREDHEHFIRTDGLITRGERYVAFREIVPWQVPDDREDEDRDEGDTSVPVTKLTSSGGLIAPNPALLFVPEPFWITYRVKNPLRRWWLRRHGWSTEWTVEYDPSERPVRDSLPRFTATRGGVD